MQTWQKATLLSFFLWSLFQILVMNFDVLVIQSSLVVSPHFLGCPHMSPRIHPGHLLLTHSLKTSRECFVPNPEGLALRSEGLCVMSFHIPTTKSRKPRSFLPLGFVSSANWSHFIHSPTNNLLMYQTPYKEMTHPFKYQLQPILRYCL